MISAISCFLYFPEGNLPPCWLFKSIKFYMVGRIDAHHHAKFSQNWSIQSRHIAIFQIFEMSPAAAILNFWNCKILLAIWVERVEVHQHAKFCQNQSISCEDIKIFWFLKMAAAKFYWLTVSGGHRRITVPNYVKIVSSIPEIENFQIVKMAATISWIFKIVKF